jgi:hypothetical protein
MYILVSIINDFSGRGKKKGKIAKKAEALFSANARHKSNRLVGQVRDTIFKKKRGQ